MPAAVGTEAGETLRWAAKGRGGRGDRMSDLGVCTEAEPRQADGGVWRLRLDQLHRRHPVRAVCENGNRGQMRGQAELVRKSGPDFRTNLWPAGKKSLPEDRRPKRLSPSSLSLFLEFLPLLVLKAQTDKTGML